jgi:hypothetical protein
MFPLRATRRSFLALCSSPFLTHLLSRGALAQTPVPVPAGFGILVASDEPGAQLALHDPGTGEQIFAFDVGSTPNAAWRTPLPGVALVRTDKALYVVDGNNGGLLLVALPETVAPSLAPIGIQFRGSAGYEKILVGTPNSDADTYLIDLLTGQRQAVVGLLQSEQPPVSLQNVAIANGDHYLLAWDGRATWIVDPTTRTSRLLGDSDFTFSAGFDSTGLRIAYSLQRPEGKTELHMQSVDGSGDQLLAESASDILVSLWLPSRDVLLLDERTDVGGILSVFDLATEKGEEILEYQGATNIVQLARDGKHALVGIEGDQGRDWYQLSLSRANPTAKLLAGLTDYQVFPGFDFHADYALGLPPIETTATATVDGIDLASGIVSRLVTGITSDAELSSPIVAPSGNAALLKIDSFTELAVHYLRLDEPDDVRVDLMKDGSGVIAPDGLGFAVSHGLNTGGRATVLHDQAGAEGVTFPGNALAWI